jgi:SHAQKYF class myb-like DNA-binding protein
MTNNSTAIRTTTRRTSNMPARRDLGLRNGIWSEDEHDRFLAAIKKFPQGPWSAIAEIVGTRSVRQVQTHTQKYYEKIMRRMRGLRKDRKTWARLEHRIDDDILEFCDLMNQSGKRSSPTLAPVVAPPAIVTGFDTDSSFHTPVRETTASSFLLSISPREVVVKRETNGATDMEVDKDCVLRAYEHPFVLDMNELDAFGLASAIVSEQKELPTLEESLDFLIEAMDA